MEVGEVNEKYLQPDFEGLHLRKKVLNEGFKRANMESVYKKMPPLLPLSKSIRMETNDITMNKSPHGPECNLRDNRYSIVCKKE